MSQVATEKAQKSHQQGGRACTERRMSPVGREEKTSLFEGMTFTEAGGWEYGFQGTDNTNGLSVRSILYHQRDGSKV